MSLPPESHKEQPMPLPSDCEGEPSEACLPSEVWLAVAAGTVPDSESRACLHHASTCSRCKVLLHAATSPLRDDASPKTNLLKSPERSKISFWQTFGIAAAATLLLAFVGYRMLRPASDTTLLARARGAGRFEAP